jgi:Protein of unknown function (DUF2934)
MDETLEDRIRKRAYEIWEHAGRSGDPEDHWLEAEREIKGEPSAAPASADPALRADAVGGPDPTAGVHADRSEKP